MIRWVYLFIFFAFLFSCDTASNVAQPNKSYFIKYFGADGNQTARDLIVNSDGTFFILGNSIASDGATQKIYIAKANAFGELIWQKTYGTPIDMDARDFLVTRDNQYLVVVSNRGSDALLSRYTLDGVKNGSDSVLISNAFANSVTELTDGGYIVEGSQENNGQSSELHFRWTGNPWGSYPGPGGVWIPNYNPDAQNATANYFGVVTIQLSPITFYTFGYTSARYQSTNDSLKFWGYHLGQYGGTGGGTSDNGIFDPNGYSTNKILTHASQAAVGGYLLAGVSSSGATTNLKVIITGSDTTTAFKPGWVLHDVLLMSISGQTIDLGNSQFATACSAVQHNFILANTYSTATGKSDMLLMKIDNTLAPMWGNSATGEPNYVLFGGDGDDTAAAVAELPDGRIMVLGTMQLGNPPAQFKISLMKLNSNGRLSD